MATFHVDTNCVIPTPHHAFEEKTVFLVGYTRFNSFICHYKSDNYLKAVEKQIDFSCNFPERQYQIVEQRIQNILLV